MALSRDIKPWHAYLGVTLTLIPLYYLLRSGGTGQSVIFVGLTATAVLAILWGVHVNQPEQRLPWHLFALALSCSVTANAFAIFQPNAPDPSWSDGFYLAAYPFAAAGLLLLMLSASGRHRLAALDDAGIVTLAFAVIQWTFVMGPAIRAAGGTADQVVDGLFPAMDVVLLAGLAGFFVSPAWRTPAFRIIAGGLTLLLAGDEAVGLAPNSYSAGSWVDATFMLAYVSLGTAALHPSMRELSEARRMPTLRVSLIRVVVLAAALLVAPVTLATQRLRGKPLDLYEILPLASGISVLVVARFTGILRALERIRLRERAARTLAEETQTQLAEQNERLVEADRLKDEFVALISHDLRTPLTSIIGYVELALDEEAGEPLDEERRSYLDVVSRSSERLLRLVDDLLFVARLQAGRLVLEPAELDLAEIAAQAVGESRPRAEQKRLALAFLGNERVPVEADRGRMFQLLDNLISNAIKFTPEGGRIDVHASCFEGSAVLEVSDTGMGLPAGEAERVFERFFRSTRAVHNQIPGTGLGLFIAQAIAEAHGGRISASNRDGGGATFRIELPARAGLGSGAPEHGELVA
ncbi:MAG: HAMP domain-containing sensor histidine kinase [Gaiellaceae bacterium]